MMATRDGVPFPQLCRIAGLPAPTAEYRFASPRRWRFDFAWVTAKVALEVEGGVFARVPGRHGRGVGYRNDLEKYNAAQIAGWRVLRVLPEQLSSPMTIDLVWQALEPR